MTQINFEPLDVKYSDLLDSGWKESLDPTQKRRPGYETKFVFGCWWYRKLKAQLKETSNDSKQAQKVP